jgi:SAM-dependent methyltransferase
VTPEAYAAAAQVEDRHWWFCARREILRAVLDRQLAPMAGRTLLEVGCGNGGNLPLLARYGQVSAVETSPEARQRAAARGLARVEAGALPDALPFADMRFDVVAALDVLEHVEEEQAALAALRARLKAGGLLLLTVPAFAWLWSGHDELSHHQRRYTRPALAEKVRAAGFRVAHATYFNTLLFPLAVAHIKLGAPQAALRIPGAGANALLKCVFSLERHLAPALRLPFGVSILLCGIAH